MPVFDSVLAELHAVNTSTAKSKEEKTSFIIVDILGYTKY
jgi:hypothetical protein